MAKLQQTIDLLVAPKLSKNDEERVRKNLIGLAQEIENIRVNPQPGLSINDLKDDLKELSEMANGIFDKTKMPTINIEELINMHSAQDMWSSFFGIMQKQFMDAWTKSIDMASKMVPAGGIVDPKAIKSMLKAKADLDAAVGRHANRKGEISKKDKVVTSINDALGFEASATLTGATKQINTAIQEYNDAIALGTDNWEAQYAAMLKYVEAYKQLKVLGAKDDTLQKYGGKIEGLNLAELVDTDLHRMTTEIRASLESIFSIAEGKGVISVNVESTVSKPVTSSNITGTKDGKIEVKIKPVVDPKDQRKLVRGVYEPEESGAQHLSKDKYGGSYWFVNTPDSKDAAKKSYADEGDNGALLQANTKAINTLTIELKTGENDFEDIQSNKLLAYLFPGLDKFEVPGLRGDDSDYTYQRFLNDMARQAGFDLFEIKNVNDSNSDIAADTVTVLQERILEYIGKLPTYIQAETYDADTERSIISQQKGSAERFFESVLQRLNVQLSEAKSIQATIDAGGAPTFTDKQYIINENFADSLNDLPMIIQDIAQMRDKALSAFDKAIEPYGGYIQSDVERGLPQTIVERDGKLIGLVSQSTLSGMLETLHHDAQESQGSDKRAQKAYERLDTKSAELLNSLPDNLRVQGEEIISDFVGMAEITQEGLNKISSFFAPYVAYDESKISTYYYPDKTNVPDSSTHEPNSAPENNSRPSKETIDAHRAENAELDEKAKKYNELIAKAAQYNDFKAFEKENLRAMIGAGVSSHEESKEIWKVGRYESFTPTEMNLEDAVDIIRNKVPENILDGWFRNADSSYKDRLEELALSDEEIRNAALNIMFSNYKGATGNNISFDDFLNSEIPVYRGKNSEKYVKGDEILSFSFDEKMAEKFGKHILQTVMKPIDTIGSYQTTAESEVFLRRNQLEAKPEYQDWHNRMAGIVENVNKTVAVLNTLPSEEDIKNGNASWRGMPIKYDVNQKNEGSNHGTYMSLGSKYFELDDSAKLDTLNHEVAHTLADRILATATENWNDVMSIFLKKMVNGNGKEYFEGLYGDLGATAGSETITRAVNEYFNDPASLQGRSTDAYNYIDQYIKNTGENLDNIADLERQKQAADGLAQSLKNVNEQQTENNRLRQEGEQIGDGQSQQPNADSDNTEMVAEIERLRYENAEQQQTISGLRAQEEYVDEENKKLRNQLYDAQMDVESWKSDARLAEEDAAEYRAEVRIEKEKHAETRNQLIAAHDQIDKLEEELASRSKQESTDDGTSKSSGINKEDLESVLTSVISAIKTEFKTDQPKDKWALDTTAREILGAIQNLKVVDTSKKTESNTSSESTQQNEQTSVPPTQDSHSGDKSKLFDAKIETQYSNLSLLYAKLESSGKLTDEIKQKWSTLWDTLGEVDDVESLQLWQQSLTQIKNEINEIAIANKDTMADTKASFDQLVAVTKLYKQMSVGAERADGEELKSFYTKEANEALVEQQNLLSSITLTQEQQAKLDSLELERKRKISEVKAKKADNANKLAIQKQEQENLQKLLGLYEQLGEFEALVQYSGDEDSKKKSKENVASIEEEIKALRKLMKLTDDDNRYDSKASAAINKGRKNVENSISSEKDKAIKQQIAGVKKLSAELGKLEARQIVDGDNQELANVIAQYRNMIKVKSQGLDIDEKSLELERLRAQAIEVNALKLKDERKEIKQQIQEKRRDARANRTQSAINAADDAIMQTSLFDEDVIADPQTLAQVKTLQNELQKLRNLKKSFDANPNVVNSTEMKQQTAEVVQQTAALKELIKNYEYFSDENSLDLGAKFDSSSDIQLQLENAARSYHGAQIKIESYDAATKTLTYTVKTGANEFTTYTAGVRGVDDALRTVQGTTKRTESFFEGIGRKMKEVFQYFSGSSIIYKGFEELRRGIQYVRDIDSAMTELKKVTDETEESYDRFLNTASKTGAKIGSTISDFTQATATFAKLGYNMNLASEMAEAAIVYQNVGDGIESADVAANSIISTMKGFGLEATDAMMIVDKFNEVGNRFAITSTEIGDALQRSASALSVGGNTIDESIGLITGGQTVVQDAEKVGTALKTLSLRLRSTKGEMEEAGEDTNGMAESVTKLQQQLLRLTHGEVNIMIDANNFKNTTQIIREMSQAWESMTDIERAEALELMGGKQQANVLAAMIENFDIIEDAIDASSDSAGSALQENEKYLDSIQGRIDQFNNAVQTMWSNALDSDVIKGFVQFGTELIKIIDKLGVVGTLLSGLAIGGMIKGKTGPIGLLSNIIGLAAEGSTKIREFGRYLSTLGSSSQPLSEAMSDLVASQVQLQASNVATEFNEQKLNAAQLSRKLTTLGLTESVTTLNAAQMMQVLQTTQLDDATKEAIIQSLGLDTTTKALTATEISNALAAKGIATADIEATLAVLGLTTANKGLAASFGVLWTAMAPMLILVAVVAAIGLAVKGVDALVKTSDELSEELSELKSKLSSTQSEIESLNSDLEHTRQKMAELEALPSLSFVDEEEFARLKQQEASLERQLEIKEALAKSQEATVQAKTEEYIESAWDSGNVDKAYRITAEGVIKKDKWWASGIDTKQALETAMSEYLNQQRHLLAYNDLIANWDYDKKVQDDDSGLALWYDDYRKIETAKQHRDQVEQRMQEIAEGINLVLGDEQYTNLQYGVSDDINTFLDEFYAYQLRWQQVQGEYVKSSAISSLFDSTSTKEMQDLGQELRDISNNDSLTDEQKNAQIKARLKNVQDMGDAYNRLNIAMNTVGVTAQDIADYFVLETGTFDSNTIEGISAQYAKLESVIGDLKAMNDDGFFTVDGERYDFDNFFTISEDGKFEAKAQEFSKILKGMDEDTRQTFINIVESAANSAGDLSEIDWDQALSKLNFSGLDRTFAVLNTEFESLNNEMFAGAADDINGLIDTVGELKAALEDVASTMDVLHTAQTQMNHSGRISVKTALELMETTADWDSILEITNGTIKLRDGAEQHLIQTELTAIKTQLHYAWTTAQTRYETALAAQGELDYASNSNVVMTAESIKAEAIGRVSAVVVALGAAMDALMAGEWGSVWSSFSNTYTSATATVVADSQQLTANIDELKKEAEDKKKIYDAFLNVDDVSEYKNNWDFDKKPGDKYKDDDSGSDDDDALDNLRKKYENQISHLEAQQEYLENEIAIAEANDQQVGKAVYDEQIRLENQKITLYKDELRALKAHQATLGKGTDEWYECADAIWEVEHNIQDSTLAIAEFKQAITDLYVEAFDKINEAFENISKLHEYNQEAIRVDIEYNELTDNPVSAESYKQIIEIQRKDYDNNQENVTALENTLAQGVANGSIKEGTQEWVDLQFQIYEAQQAANEARNEIEKTNDELKELYITAFDKVREAYDSLTNLYSNRKTYIENQIEIEESADEDYIASRAAYDYLITQEKAIKEVKQQQLEDQISMLQNAVDSGDIDIGSEQWIQMKENITETTLEIQECNKNINQFGNSIKDLYVEAFSKLQEAFDSLGNLRSNRQSYIDQYMKLMELNGEPITTDYYDLKIDEANQSLAESINLVESLRDKQEDALRNGDIEYGSQRWLEMEENIRKAEASILDSKIALAEFNKELKTLYFDAFNKVADAFGDEQSVYDDQQSFIDSYIDYLNTMDISVPTELYEKKIAIEEQSLERNMQQLAGLYAKRDQMLAEGFTYQDEELIEANSKINELEQSTWDAKVAIEEWNKAIRELDISKFEEIEKRISDIFDELENVYGLISDEDVATEDGIWTDEGITSLGLMIQKMELAKAKSQEYQKEIEKLTEEYKTGAISEQEYNDRLVDLKNSQWDAINSYEDAKDAIIDINETRIDLIEEGLNKEIEAYQELIDIKKKELDAEKDLYDFRKNIKDQTKDIASLERKIAAMSGSSDAATVAERTKLEAD